MSEIVSDCPRCKAEKITFDVLEAHYISKRYGWQRCYEAFCVCRNCNRSTVFRLSQILVDVNFDKIDLTSLKVSVNNYMKIDGHINIKDMGTVKSPEHLPIDIEKIFLEGTSCMAIECYNASATMFRLCVDMATINMVSIEDDTKKRKSLEYSLGLRLNYLFDNNILPESLQDLSSCIKDDGNDGAHKGTIGEKEAEDLLDFTVALLERIFTEPEKLKLAKKRREKRRGKG